MQNEMASPVVKIPPLICIFYAEFDAKVGPKIVYQVPADKEIISKEVFDSVSSFIITKPELLNKLVKINLPELKIMGYPIAIEGNKYERNALYFNVCFVVENVSKNLETFERECDFLSDDSCRGQLVTILTNIFDSINAKGQCSIEINDKCAIHLKLPHFADLPARVSPCDMPVLCKPVSEEDRRLLDVVSQKIIPHITGFNDVANIGDTVQVDIAIVERCITNLEYHGLVRLLPLFQYRNFYRVTPKIRHLYQDRQLQAEFCRVVAFCPSAKPPLFRDIFRLLCSIQPTIAIKDWCPRELPRDYNVDERKLVQFAVFHGILWKLTGRPFLVPAAVSDTGAAIANDKQPITSGKPFVLDGSVSVEEISFRMGCTIAQVEKEIERNENVLVLWN
ncbi:unnamed protein product [Soboliphyme baturini]|uniref:Nitrogen permease regulator 2 n=1 Tax=Soboliphyme baturini TaxID=241478 RepID=A0A183J623_9BILA|nr:unnamed protein product [Soboliphyme baturini]